MSSQKTIGTPAQFEQAMRSEYAERAAYKARVRVLTDRILALPADRQAAFLAACKAQGSDGGYDEIEDEIKVACHHAGTLSDTDSDPADAVYTARSNARLAELEAWQA